ncbi:restriction endonuclease [Tenacibaculum aquimarinum]|uniref:restriction endonuclease n=1 Tax=Tenacibaculum aquimarinum TaxID=2910675 RepID=UPI001F0A76BC|nr:restriction endonuclease [Tenacibaculum aquimarinum]MCH3883402.1 restriction endonuclease [Tenacibaculum aquimarinum]
MKNNGKSLEKTIRLIQETLKDSENTKIFNNYKIENESGQKREIDILIVSSINDFDIKIAIECKDYNKKVPVKEIEAFESKCDRIKEINKKVFVSTNGYQADAINTAKYYGIELHTANKLKREDIQSWFPIKQMGLQIESKFIAPTLYLDSTQEILETILKDFNGIVYRENINEPIKIETLLIEAIENNKRVIMNLALIEWIKLEETKKDESFPIQFKLDFNDYYIKSTDIEKIKLFGLTSSVYVKFVKRDAIVLSGRIVKGSKENDITKSITIDVGGNLKSDIIIDKNEDLTFFATNEKGESEKLKTLFTYNPKTKKFNEK